MSKGILAPGQALFLIKFCDQNQGTRREDHLTIERRQQMWWMTSGSGGKWRVRRDNGKHGSNRRPAELAENSSIVMEGARGQGVNSDGRWGKAREIGGSDGWKYAWLIRGQMRQGVLYWSPKNGNIWGGVKFLTFSEDKCGLWKYLLRRNTVSNLPRGN